MMIWLRCVGWFVFLLLLSCPIAIAENSEKVIVENFDDIYYMEGSGSVEISTKITFIGDDLNNGDVPIEVRYYTEDWEILSSEEVDNNKVRIKVGMDGYDPIYEYHDYTTSFGFDAGFTGDVKFRLMIDLGDHRGYNEIHTVRVDANNNPNDNPTNEEVLFTSTVIVFILIIIIITVMSIAAGKVMIERRELSSETSTDLELNPTDTELEISMTNDTFKVVPDVRGARVLESQTSHSEIEIDEI